VEEDRLCLTSKISALAGDMGLVSLVSMVISVSSSIDSEVAVSSSISTQMNVVSKIELEAL